MTANFGPEKVKQLLKEKEEKEQLQQQEELEKKRQAEEREAAEKAAKEAERAKADQPREQKEDERGIVRGNYLNTLVDWQLEDLEASIVSGRVVPQVNAQGVAVTFILYDRSHDLTGNMLEALVERLTKRLRKSWDSIEIETATDFTWSDSNSKEYRVGIQFKLAKRN